MGILFPRVIPTICELESAHGAQCRVDIIIQSAAAIMASSIFGNGNKIVTPNSQCHVGRSLLNIQRPSIVTYLRQNWLDLLN